MLICRGCGQSVGHNRFCSTCMTSVYVKEVKDESKIDLPKVISSISNEPPLPTLHGKNEGEHIVYSPIKPTTEFKQVTCYCGAKFLRKDLFELHVTSYKHYTCYYCEEKYDTYESFESHIEKCNKFLTRDKTFKCPVCKSNFKSENAVNRHIKLKHDKKKRFGCDFCEGIFKSEYALNRHVEKKHSSEQMKKN